MKEKIEKKILRCIAEIKKHNFLARYGVETYVKKNYFVKELVRLTISQKYCKEAPSIKVEVTFIEAQDYYHHLYRFTLLVGGETIGIGHIPMEIADNWQIRRWVNVKQPF